ncbi:MAG TPA: sigma-70 family RNA polymerase sigma factor [candidate division Zixibacteria bacterium]
MRNNSEHKAGTNLTARRDKRRKDHFVDYYTCSLGYGRKKRKRIRTLNWVSGKEEPEFALGEFELIQKIKDEESSVELEGIVAKALDKLDSLEREFIRYFYYDCLSYSQISQQLDKTKDRLERIHRSALEKLRSGLKDYVSQRYKLKISQEKRCLICSHPLRNELDDLIKTKKKEETWKNVLRIFKEKYNLEIKTPQVLINHQRKHMFEL